MNRASNASHENEQKRTVQQTSKGSWPYNIFMSEQQLVRTKEVRNVRARTVALNPHSLYWSLARLLASDNRAGCFMSDERDLLLLLSSSCLAVRQNANTQRRTHTRTQTHAQTRPYPSVCVCCLLVFHASIKYRKKPLWS